MSKYENREKDWWRRKTPMFVSVLSALTAIGTVLVAQVYFTENRWVFMQTAGIGVGMVILIAVVFVFGAARLRANFGPDQVSAQEQLRRQAQVIDQSLESIVTTDMEGNITSWNRGAERVFGHVAKDAIGRNIGIVYATGIKALKTDVIDPVLVNGKADYEALYVRADGDEFHGHTIVSLLHDEQGDPRGLIGFTLDISDRKRAEDELRRAYAEMEQRVVRRTEQVRLQAEIIEQIHDAVVSTDLDGTITSWNTGAKTIFKYQTDEILGRHLSVLSTRFNHNEFESSVARPLKDAGAMDFESTLVRDGGEAFDGQVSLTLARGNNGIPTGIIGYVRDVSERKAAEQALRLSERNLKSITDRSPVGIFRCDLGGRITYVNKRWSDMMGAEPGADLDRAWNDVVHPDDRDKVYTEWRELLAGGDQYMQECRLVRPDGSTVWVLGHITPEHGNTGNLIGFIGTITDITERKHTEAALLASEEKFRAITENTSDITAIISPEGVITYINEAASNILGYPEVEFVDAGPEKFVIPEDRGAFAGQLDQALSAPGETLQLPQFRAVSRNGHIVHFEGLITALPDVPGVEGVVFNARDITERIVAERSAVEAKERAELMRARLNDAIESLDEGFILYDADDRFVLCNTSYRKQFKALSKHLELGADFETFMRAIYTSKAFLDEDYRTEEILQKRLASHRAGIKEPWTVREVDGGWVMIQEYRTHEGGTAMIRSDITARVEAEREIIAARDLAEAASQAKSEFLSSMSHELRTPMNAILGFGQLLEFEAKNLSDPHKDYVAEILKAGEHLMDLIVEVLDLSRIESGQMEVDLQQIDPRDAIDECLKMTRSLASERSIRVIDKSSDRELPTITADNVRLKQVLLNVLSNAIKYNVDGGHVEFDCRETGDGNLGFFVSDTGPGIAADMRDRIFEPFDRLGAENSNILGTGVGLTITKRIIGLMNGSIDFSSEPGKGSQFWFELPLGRARSNA